LIKAFPDLDDSKDAKNRKNGIKISQQISETDIVLISDSSLIENISLAFLTVLLNFGLSKIAKNQKWDVKNDSQLNELMEDYVLKMSNENTIRYTFHKTTGNPKITTPADKDAVTTFTSKDLKDAHKMNLLTGCPLKSYFPTFRNFGDKINFFSTQTSCLEDFTKLRFFSQGAVSPDFRVANVDAVTNHFQPKIIAEMFGEALQKVQNCLTTKIHSSKTPVKNFLSYQNVRKWRDRVSIEEIERKRDPHMDASHHLINWSRERFQELLDTKELDQKVITPVEGDASIFVNILVGSNDGPDKPKNAPQEKHVTKNDLVWSSPTQYDKDELKAKLSRFSDLAESANFEKNMADMFDFDHNSLEDIFTQMDMEFRII